MRRVLCRYNLDCRFTSFAAPRPSNKEVTNVCAQVRIRCADQKCHEYDLCVPCFSDGKYTKEHDPQKHSFQVIEQHSIPIFTEGWGADEELALLEGAETYGLGSWADIADHIGGFREKDEVRDHYVDTYVRSSKFPLPEHCSPEDKEISQKIPREEFQARKKRRIEDRKEAARNAPPATPKQKPTASVPACHEVQGYMPGRLEFETEYFNEAEEAVQHMQFEPGDGTDPRTGQFDHDLKDPEMKLKMTVMEIYNSRLTARVERKKIIFEHKLLDYRENMKQDKKRTKEERDLVNKAKPFARMMKHDDFVELCAGLEKEQNLRQAIGQLQEWRQNQISDLNAGRKYEEEKHARAQKQAASGAFDRLAASSRLPKPIPPVEVASEASALVSPDLPMRVHHGLITPASSVSPTEKSLANGVSNGHAPVVPQKPKFSASPLPGTVPLKFNSDTPDLQLLTPDERELCSVLRIMPKPYNMIKNTMIAEAIKNGGSLKKKAAREICKIDQNKGARLFDFFVHAGWISKA